MRLRGIKKSRNIEDRRGRGRAGVAGGLGIGGILAVLAIGWLTGVDVMLLLSGGSAPTTSSQSLTAADERAGAFASRVLTTTEAVWAHEFPAQLQRDYRLRRHIQPLRRGLGCRGSVLLPG